jgi:DnaJ-class molecular chaperone
MTIDLLLAVLAVVSTYVIVCGVSPFGRCRRCHGTGRYKRPHGRQSHPCRRCHTSGRRLRWGRHVSNYFARRRDAAAKVTEQRGRGHR